MSFDPYGQNQFQQNPQPQPQPTPTPPNPQPGPPAADLNKMMIRERLMMPAMLLIVAGVLNLLGAFGAFAVGGFTATIPTEKFEEEMRKNPQQSAQLDQLKQAGMSTQDVLNIYIWGGLGSGCLVVPFSLLTIAGGVRMLSLRNYGLAVISASIAAVPCLSPSACPCGVGMLVGIYALVVLMSPDVRAAFR